MSRADYRAADRWAPLSVATFAREALAFPVGVVAGVSLVLLSAPAPELFGRLGIGIFAVLALAPTVVPFLGGFLVGQRKWPMGSGWPRTLRSTLVGLLFGVGWLGIDKLAILLASWLAAPDYFRSILLWSYWLLGPILFAVGVSFVWRSSSTRPALERRSGAA
jgi:hypothetical protein